VEKSLTVSTSTFRDNKQALYSIFSVCSYNYQSTAKQHHFSDKIIEDAGSSQRDKSWSSHLHSTCTLLQVKRNLL